MIVFVAITIFAVLAWLSYFFWKRLRNKKTSESLQLKLFLIRLPRTTKEGKELKQEINRTEQLLGALSSFKKPFVFEVAVPHLGEEIHFYAAVPSSLADVFVRQIQSLWNDAEITPSEDYNIFNYAGVSQGAVITEKDRFVLPIRSYVDLSADTFSPILGGFNKIKEVGEGSALQLIIRPAVGSYRKEIKSVLQSLRKGNKISDMIKRGPSPIPSFSDVREALSPKKEIKEKILDESAIKALESKSSKPLFEVNVRILSSAPSDYEASAILESVAAGFSQFSSPDRNSFKITRPKNIKNLVHKFSFREFDESDAMFLTSEEVASIFHLPTPFTDIPKIKELKAREAPPPSNLPKEGILIGESHYRGQINQVRITDVDRGRHVYIVGQTGTGKSNLLTNMAVNDIRNGKGVAVLDPHGDFTEDILSLIPKNRIDDVIVFDPGDITKPLGLNMLEYDHNKPEEKTFIVNEMQGIFNKLFSQETMGPMFEQYMRNALLLLMEDAQNEPATLVEVARVFTDVEYRKRKLERIKNPTVQDFWEKEAAKAGGEAALSNMTPYITSKFNNFTANDYMRVIIGQEKSSFNFRKLMDEGKILIVNLSKGKIGDINANLLGMVLVGKILMAALGRVDVPQEKRRDFNLYIDEFQNFTTDSIAVILSEARKYKLNLTIAHQFIAQLTEKIRDAVFGNVGSLISFRVGAQDAEFLGKQFKPVFVEQDLMNIDNFNVYVKLLINGQTSPPFNIKTLRVERGNPALVEELKDLSRNKYGKDRVSIEEDIYKRLRS
ncbi:MAG: DUF87 domain-containing protein [Patescibacteria group bacterium]|mgnify:CR=1 FL=1